MEILFICIGMVLSYLLGFYFRPRIINHGSFEMESRADKDIWRVVLDVDLDDLPKKQYLILKIESDAHLTGGIIDEQF